MRTSVSRRELYRALETGGGLGRTVHRQQRHAAIEVSGLIVVAHRQRTIEVAQRLFTALQLGQRHGDVSVKFGGGRADLHSPAKRARGVLMSIQRLVRRA
jgi:hypothetical protein